jgi:hypothetical protein
MANSGHSSNMFSVYASRCARAARKGSNGTPSAEPRAHGYLLVIRDERLSEHERPLRYRYFVRALFTAAVALALVLAPACRSEDAPYASPANDASSDATSCTPGVTCLVPCDGGIGDESCRHPATDADVGADATLVCAPGDVSSFTPSHHPANPHRGACTQRLIDDFYSACLGLDSILPCSVFFAADADALHKACADCILTPSTAPTYGPVISKKGTVDLNVAGCMELADSVNGLACGMAYDASNQCVDAACAATCPVTDEASLQRYQACVQQASASGCLNYTQAAKCADAEADGGPASICFSGQTFQDLYNNIVPLFCLAAIDGGSDASGD